MLVFSAVVFAQNESGVRPINKGAFQKLGFWYDSSTAVFQIRYPIIRNIPPISTGQPFQILLDYIYLDSALRVGGGGALDKRVKAWTSLNDTMTSILQGFYQMVDYNPIIFSQYLYETSLNRYKTAGIWGKEALLDKFLQVTKTMPTSRAYYSALLAEYVLRVQVVSIDSAFQKQTPLGYKCYRVTARILDTLKGKVFAAVPCELPGVKGTPNQTLSECWRMQFQYTPLNYSAVGSNSEDPYLYPERDSAFMNGRGEFRMSVGQEVVVFLSQVDGRVDSSYDYLDLGVEPRASYNALPIIDGNVRDLNHVWSGSTILPYEEWKGKFMEIRNGILTRSY
ncbi:MAG: hypothetical protein ABI876_04740 [Bacteroidota bacterium]